MVVVYGEILVDMVKEKGNNSFNYFIGGAPFNVSYAISKVNKNVLFVGNVGNDLLGKFLKDEVKNYNLDNSYVYIDNNHNTTQAFVINDENGERNFCFARKFCADYYIPASSLSLINKANIIHLGSLMLSTKAGLSFANKVINKAKDENKIISFDINYRDDIYNSKEEAIKIYKNIYKKCDIIKISNDELELLTNKSDLLEALKDFTNNNQKVFVTLGKDGSLLYFNNKVIKASTIKVNPIDTTGAGDAFYGTILGFIDKYGYDLFFNDEELIKECLKKANVQGAMATLKKGAISGVVGEAMLEKESMNS